MSLSATMKIGISAVKTKAIDLDSASENLNKLYSSAYSDGAGAGQANLLWHDTRTLAASATEDIDVSGTLTDIYGDAAVFARIKGLIIAAAAGNTNNVNVTRPASNGVPWLLAAGDGIAVKPECASHFSTPEQRVLL